LSPARPGLNRYNSGRGSCLKITSGSGEIQRGPAMSQDSRVDPVQSAETKPSTDGFAIAALVCAILSFVPLGLLFGIIALVRIRKRGRSGRGLAITSLVIS